MDQIAALELLDLTDPTEIGPEAELGVVSFDHDRTRSDSISSLLGQEKVPKLYGEGLPTYGSLGL